MKTKTMKAPKPGVTTTAVAVTALLTGVALGATAYARRKELGKVAQTTTEKVGDTASKTSAKLIDLFGSAKTKLGDAVISFADGMAHARSMKIQALRNPEILHPRRDAA